MLIDFRVTNFLSFKGEAKLSMVASALKERKIDDESVMFNPTDISKIKLLKSAVVYGANASGKSNLIKAISFFKKFILDSSKGTQADEKINISNFQLSTETENDSSVFEIIFTIKNTQYRYGFAICPAQIDAEWLYYKELKGKAKENEVYFRTENSFEVSKKFSIGKDLANKQMIRPNALLLSVAAQFNEPMAIDIIHWLNNLNPISGNMRGLFSPYTLSKLEEPEFKERILDFTKYADLGIDDIKISQGEISNVNVAMKDGQDDESVKEKLIGKPVSALMSVHQKYDKDLKEKSLVHFLFNQSESEGTIKYFSLAGPILDTLDNGKILIIDELDSKLHTLLTQKIISLFNSKETNPKNAQLIFTTHDTNLLSSHLFRRDQIWFTQKDRYGATSLYSLADYIVAVRNDASFEKDYLSGKYGATPVLKNFSKLFNHPKV